MQSSSGVPGPAARLEGFLAGAAVGASLAASTVAAADAEAVSALLGGRAVGPLAPPPGRRRAPIALGDALLEELVGGGVDLRRLAGRWTAWFRDDGLDADPSLADAIKHLAEFDAPRADGGGTCPAAIAAALPAALTSSNPQAMVAGAFHVARLLDPDEATALATVAAVVTAARLLAGHRDFIPDVLAVLRANDAAGDVVEAVARVPRDPRSAPPVPGHDAGPLATLSWLLWTVHHRPRGVAVLEQMVLTGGVPIAAGSVLGALVGARDGIDAWPQRWLDGAGEDVVLRRSLAARLSSAATS